MFQLEKFEFILESQKLETNYYIAVIGTNKDSTRESNMSWLNFSTSDCFSYYPNDLTKCGMYLLRLSQKVITIVKKIIEYISTNFFYLE
jgi:hypothetical protein